MKLQDVYQDKGLLKYATTMTGNVEDAKELISKCVCACIENKEKINAIEQRGKLKNYFVVMIKFQYLKSKRDGRIFDELPQEILDEQNDFTFEERKERVQWTLDKMHFYSRGLLELYKHDTYRGIAAKTKINYMSVANGINAAKDEFKKIYNQMKIVVLLPTMSAVEYHRLFIPMNMFAEQYGSDVKIIGTNTENNANDNWINNIPQETSHVIFNRNISSKMQPELIISTLRKKGIKIICDVDDYWFLPKHHSLYNYYIKTNMSKCIQANIQLADVVWTTTKRLQNEIGKINPNVHIVKNCLDTNESQWDKTDVTDSFMWAGGVTHKRDLKILQNQVDTIDFTIYGYLPKFDYMPKMFPNATLKPFEPLHEYGNTFNAHGIVLIPLIENQFNSMKSELKLIEAGQKGKAAIVSNVFPYKQHIKHLESGLIVSNDNWGKSINYISKNRNAAIEMAESLNEYITRNYRLNKENKIRFDTL